MTSTRSSRYSAFLDKMRIISMDYLLAQLASGNVDELRKIFAALMNYLLAYFSNEAQADTQATSALQIRRTGEKVNIATHVTVSKGVPTVVGKVTMERSLSQALAEFTGNSKRPFLGWLIQWSEAVCPYNEQTDQDAPLHGVVQQQIVEFVRDAKFPETKKAFKDFVDNEQSWSALRQMWFVHGGRDLFCRHLTRNGDGGASGSPTLSASSSFVSLGGSMLTAANSLAASPIARASSSFVQTLTGGGEVAAPEAQDVEPPEVEPPEVEQVEPEKALALAETTTTIGKAREVWGRSQPQERETMAKAINDLFLGHDESKGMATAENFDENIKLIAEKLIAMEATKLIAVRMLSRGFDAARGNDFVKMAQEFFNALGAAYGGEANSVRDGGASEPFSLNGRRPQPMTFKAGVSRQGHLSFSSHLKNDPNSLFDLQMDIKIGDGKMGSIWRTFKAVTHQELPGGDEMEKFDLLEFLVYSAHQICPAKAWEGWHHGFNVYLESRTKAYRDRQTDLAKAKAAFKDHAKDDHLREEFRHLLTVFFGHPPDHSAYRRMKITVKRYITDDGLWEMLKTVLEKYDIFGLLCQREEDHTNNLSATSDQHDIAAAPTQPEGGPATIPGRGPARIPVPPHSDDSAEVETAEENDLVGPGGFFVRQAQLFGAASDAKSFLSGVGNGAKEEGQRSDGVQPYPRADDDVVLV
ncbi:unnamed protein product [Amoebophrya sp. A25]|nr:unnamed protein product [Amoebophrya sp. A25]|eukprot:GSA25T00027154001.1